MSVARHYLGIDSAANAQEAFSILMMANGDAAFTSDKRMAEAFFIRGRNRTLNMDLFSFAVSDEEDKDESSILDEDASVLRDSIGILNQYLVPQIKSIEVEYKEAGRITKSITSKILDLKTAYVFILSRAGSKYLSKIAMPNLEKSNLPAEVFSMEHLGEGPELKNFKMSNIYTPNRTDSIFVQKIKSRIHSDLYLILDKLISYFEEKENWELVEDIKVSEFDVISKPASDIISKYNLVDQDATEVENARLNYISKTKIQVQYALELIGLAASTFKRRQGAVAERLIELGSENQTGRKNRMNEYLLN